MKLPAHGKPISPNEPKAPAGDQQRNIPVRSEIRAGLFEVHFFDPRIAITDVVTLGLQLQPLRRVGDAPAVVVPAIDARVRPTPDLADGEVRVNFEAVE